VQMNLELFPVDSQVLDAHGSCTFSFILRKCPFGGCVVVKTCHGPHARGGGGEVCSFACLLLVLNVGTYY